MKLRRDGKWGEGEMEVWKDGQKDTWRDKEIKRVQREEDIWRKRYVKITEQKIKFKIIVNINIEVEFK